MAEGNVERACVAFEDSLRLDYQLGALYNLAQCNERRGRLASALAAYRKIASEDTVNLARADKARELADLLEPRVPRLTITIVGNRPATIVTLDGAGVRPSTPIPIDLGTHVAVATAPGSVEARRTFEVTREGQPVAIELVVPAPATDPIREPTTEIDVPKPGTTALAGKITFAAGVTTVAAGFVLGGLTFRGWRDAQDLAMTDPAAANRDLDGVRTLGNASTAAVAVGTAAIGVGLYLWSR